MMGSLVVLSAAIGCAGDDEPSDPALTIRESAVPAATVGSPYEATLSIVEEDRDDATWLVGDGDLPAGIALEGSGRSVVLTGTPTEAGTFEVTISASAPGGLTDSVDLTLVVNEALAIVTTVAKRRGSRLRVLGEYHGDGRNRELYVDGRGRCAASRPYVE